MVPNNKLSEYERKRIENIRRNHEMVAALKLRSAAANLSEATAATAAKRQRDAQTKSYKSNMEEKRSKKTETPTVIRRSLRAQGMPPDSKGLDYDAQTDTSHKTHQSSSPARRPSRVLGPLSMDYAYNSMGTGRALKDVVLSVVKKSQPEVSVTVEVVCDKWVKSKDSDVHEDTGSVKNEYSECRAKVEQKESVGYVNLWSMRLEEENVARIVPGKILTVKFVPCDNVRMVVAGNKYGNVGFWNMDSQGEDGDGIYLYHPHTDPVSSILFEHSCLSKIYTGSFDGLIRLMDAEKEVFNLVYTSDHCVYALGQRSSDVKSLYISEGHGNLSIWDERTGSVSSQWTLHESRINTIDFNSIDPNIMATSSSDGTACLWDLRYVNAEKRNSLKTLRHKKAVQSAYFSPSGFCLATTSTDDNIGIFSGADFENTEMVCHNNQTGRWIPTFRAIWGWDDSYLFVGKMQRGFDVISRAQGQIITTLDSPFITAIPCRFDAHPYKVGMLAGATSGGQVYVWT